MRDMNLVGCGARESQHPRTSQSDQTLHRCLTAILSPVQTVQRKSKRSPDCAGRLHDPFELSPLLVFVELHGADTAAEAALRAERELVERQISCGILDTPLQIIKRFDV